MGWLVTGLALVLPDLGRFTSTAWLVDGPDGLPALAFVAGETLVYSVLIALAGMFDLYRKNL